MAAAAICPNEFDWGQWSVSYGVPKLTPYAQAIIAQYDQSVPLFLSVPFSLQGSTSERRMIVAAPQQYDCLLIGAALNDVTGGDQGQQIYLNVWDRRTQLHWVTPSPIGWAPLTAFAGLPPFTMPILALPEAYFLPRHVELQHEIWNFTDIGAEGGNITWVGLQLINACQKPATDRVTLANGKTVKIGSRQPLLMPVPIGLQTFDAGVFSWIIDVGGQYVSYTEPLDCDAEIHDVASACLFSSNDTLLDPDNVLIKITDMGDREMWRPDRAPSTAVVGDFTQVFPALPFTMPYILRKGHRLQISVQNNIPLTQLENVVITIRGVRLCEY